MIIRFFFFFNDTATTEIYTLSLHDALPILPGLPTRPGAGDRGGAGRRGRARRDAHGRGQVPLLPVAGVPAARLHRRDLAADRKSTRLNSSHANISYAVFCLKKKK